MKENYRESGTGVSPYNMYGLGLHHYADQTVDGGSSSDSETSGTPPDPSTFQADVQGTSTLETGDVVGGNVDNTKVCQVNNADPAQCQPQVVRWIVLPGRPTVLTRPVTTNTDRDGAHGQDGDASGRPGGQVRSVVVTSGPAARYEARRCPSPVPRPTQPLVCRPAARCRCVSRAGGRPGAAAASHWLGGHRATRGTRRLRAGGSGPQRVDRRRRRVRASDNAIRSGRRRVGRSGGDGDHAHPLPRRPARCHLPLPRR